jgi:photosystem II stability/assembly factor-like uncharacterized protein
MTRLKLLSAALLVLVGEQTFAQSYSWQQTSGPEGGIVDAILAVDSQNLLVSIDGGNVYRSTNGGTSWTRIASTGYSYAFVATPAGAIYSGGTLGISRSTDRGATWSSAGISFPITATPYSFCADSSGRLFCGSYGNKGIFRSTDNGATWVQNGLTTADFINEISANKSGGVYAATNIGVFRSTDGGNNWVQVNNGLTVLDVRAIIATSTYVFAGTLAGGVFRSIDGGNSWTHMSTGLTNEVNSLALGPFGQLYAGTNVGVYRSVDNANNWSQMSSSGLIPIVYHLVVKSDGTLIAGNSFGIFRSTDLGNNWDRINTGVKGGFMYSVAANSNGYIFGGAHGIFRSSDLGSSWTSVGPQNGYARLLATSTTSAVYAGTDVGVYRSTDDGATWLSTPVAFAQVLAVAPSGIVFVGHSTAMLRSTNGGVSWDSINTGLPKASRRAIGITPAGVVYVSVSGNGLYRSSNNGTTWTLSTLTQEVTSLCCPQTGVVLACTGATGFYRSSDNGQSWTVLNNGVGLSNVYALVANSRGDIFASAVGVYQSTDAGNSWISVGQGVTSSVISMAVSREGNLIAGTGGSGVFRGDLVASGVKGSSVLPVDFALEQNYPNPFNPSTIINYQVSAPGRVLLRVFNAIGQEVAVLVNEQKNPGAYSIRWDAQVAPSGIYFYRLQAGDRLETKKMVYLR